MKVKIFVFLNSLFAALSPVFAQYADLLNDRNISWVAEHTADFDLNPVTCYWNEFELNNSVNVMQFNIAPTKQGLFEYPYFKDFFSQKILDGIKAGAYSCFSDNQLEMPLSQEQVLQLLAPTDTIVGPDPETFEDEMFIYHNELGAQDLAGFRVRQVFYYDKTNRVFGSRIVALAPVINFEDEMGDFIENKPLFWLKIEAPPKNWNKTDPKEVGYAFETRMLGNAPYFSDFVLKRGRIDFLQLIVNEVAQPSHPVLDPDFKPIDPSKLQDYVLLTDTVISYSPDTFEERIEIVQRNVLKDVESVGFVQHWFYDEQKKLFFNRVAAIAPKVAVKDFEGNIQYNRVLFYMMNK